MKKPAAYIMTAAVILSLCACSKELPTERIGGVYLEIEAEGIYSIAYQTDGDSGIVSNDDGSPFEKGEEIALGFGDTEEMNTGTYIIAYTLTAYGQGEAALSSATFTSDLSYGARVDLRLTEDYSFITVQEDSVPQTERVPDKEIETELSATPTANTEQGDAEILGVAHVIVESESIEQEYLGADGTTPIFSFSSLIPTVAIERSPEAAQTINDTLKALQEAFVEGGQNPDGSRYGLEAYLGMAQQAFDAGVENSGGASGFTPYLMQRRVGVARGDTALISFVVDDTVYLGGADETNTRSGVTFNAVTGERVFFKDLTQYSQGLKSLCARYILELTQSETYKGIRFNDGYEESVSSLVGDDLWYLSDSGIVFVANPGVLAPADGGIAEFTVPYSELTAFLNSEQIPDIAEGYDGTISGVIERSPADTDCSVVASAGEAGVGILLCAQGGVRALSVYSVIYMVDENDFYEDALLVYANYLDSREAVRILTESADTAPDLLVLWVAPDGTVRRRLIKESGNDGTFVLAPVADEQPLPAEISGELPVEIDLDNDGSRETITLLEPTSDTGFALSILSAESTSTAASIIQENISVWISDTDSDGYTEIFLSGSSSPDDFITYCWRFEDGLQPVCFSGETRGGADPELITDFAAGRVVSFDGSAVVIASYTDMLGTYSGTRPYAMTVEGVLAPMGGTLWQYGQNNAWLETLRELPVRLTGGTISYLPVGTKLLLTASDGMAESWFVTLDGITGSIRAAYAPQGDVWQIDGIDDIEYFVSLPYAP